jgi:SAM-dependent methyltransferase
MLKQIIDNNRTDKNTVHSYLELYELLFRHKKYTASDVLEIGIHKGGSIKLWHDYFINSNVHALDSLKIDEVWDEIKNKDRIKLYTHVDAYDLNFFYKTFNDKTFDLVLDDGPHTLDSMIAFITLYSKVLKEDGILVIEDIQSWDWVDFLKKVVPDELKQFVFVFDLRANKNRYDDILFVINKSWK